MIEPPCDPLEIALTWARIRPLYPLIQLALDRAGNVMTLEDLQGLTMSGAVQIWMTDSASACMFTEVVSYPRVEAIRSMYTAGDMRAAMALIPRIARWALSRGCTRAEFSASPGWLRVGLGRRFTIQTAFCAAPLTALIEEAS